MHAMRVCINLFPYDISLSPNPRVGHVNRAATWTCVLEGLNVSWESTQGVEGSKK